MADLQKTIEIVFGGRNDLSKVVGQVESSLSGLENATAPFAGMADDILQAQTAVVALAAAFAGLSINQAGTFNDQFAEINTLIDESVGSLSGYRQEILNYANDSTQSIDSINGAVYSAISAGVDYTRALGLMNDAEELSVAGKADLNSTLIAMASTMNAYGAETEQAADYSDIFFTTVKQGQTTIPELAASLSQVTSTASAAGVPFDDLSAAIAALTANGMPTAQAITSIKAALSNIIKPSTDAKKQAEELGIEFNTTALRTQGLSGFLQTLYTATDGNIDTMARLFGSVEGLNGVMALAGDTSGIFAKSLEAMENRSGATSTAFEKMVDNFGLGNQRLVNNIQTVLIGVGGKLLDEYGDIVNSLIANLQGIGSAVDAGDLDGLIGIFEKAMADIDSLLTGMAAALPEALSGANWSNLFTSFDGLKESVSDAFSAVFGDIDLTSVDGLRDGIQTVVDLLSGLTNLSTGVIEGMAPLFEMIGELAENFTNADASGQQFAGNIIGVGKSVNEITGFLSGATSVVGGLSNGLLLLGGGSVLNGLTSLVSLIGGAGGLTAVLSAAAPAAAALGAAWGAVQIYNLGNEIGATVDAYREAAAAEERLAESTAILAERYRVISERTGVNITSHQELIAAMNEGLIVYNKATHTWEEASTVLQIIPRTAEEVAQQFRDIGWEIDADGNIKKFITVIEDDLGGAAKTVASQFEQMASSVRSDLGISNKTISGTFNVISNASDKAADSLKNAIDEGEKLHQKMLDLASDERIKGMELSVDLKTAQIESDTKVAVAAFDAMKASIQSTGETLVDLTGQLNSFAGADKRFLEDLIGKENDRRQALIDAQVENIQAQTDYLDARTKTIKSGDALIKISGDGLAPQLEAFMWEVLKAVQVRATEDNAAFLLGL